MSTRRRCTLANAPITRLATLALLAASAVMQPLTSRAGQAPAGTLYVRADIGSDANDGRSPHTALQTIGWAAQSATAGDRIVVGSGVYQEGDIRLLATFGRVTFVADTSGLEVGAPPGPVVVDATGFTTGFDVNNNLAVTISGFVVRGAAIGIHVKSQSHQSQVINNIVTATGQNGIYVQDSNQVLVFNNLVYANHGVGILVTGDTTGSSRTAIINNTVYANEGRGIFFSGTTVASPDGRVLNNAVEGNLGNNRTGIQVNPVSLPGYVSAGNVSADRFPTGTPVDPTDRRVTVLFAAEPSGADGVLGGVGFADDEFHLRQVAAGQAENSPAVDAGVVSADALGLSEATTRTDGQPDDGWVDAGYHYGGRGTATVPDVAELRHAAIYVDSVNGSNGRNGETPSAALRTIAAALDVARAGHGVVLAPGLYREGNLTLRAPSSGTRDLSITGQAGTVIDASSQARALSIDDGYVRMTDLAVVGAQVAAVRVRNLAHVELAGVTLSNNARGLLLEESASVSLADVTITGSRIAGVQLRTASRAELTGVSISRNTGIAVWAQEQSVVTISSSRLDQNRIGVRNEDSEVSITSCMLCASCQEGVRTKGGTLRVVDSVVELGRDDGVTVFDASEFELLGTVVGNNAKTGVQVNLTETVAVLDSVLFSNGGPGLRLFDVPGPAVANNLVYGNASSGLVISGDIDGSPAATVLNNTFYGNANRGLLLGGSDLEPPSPSSTVLRNLFEGNGVAGLQINRLSLPGYHGDYNLNADGYGPGTPVGEHDVVATASFVDPDGPDDQLGGTGVADDDFRLEQFAAGQTRQSPAVDAGGVDAVAAGMANGTTRTDGGLDSGMVDLGYHYAASALAHCDVQLAERSCEMILTADCDGDGRVSVNELVLGVNMALEQTPLAACPSFDSNDNGRVGIEELLGAVLALLETV